MAARTRFGPSKYSLSGTVWGLFFHSIARCSALIPTFGTGLCPAKFKYVAFSNSCHSLRQSTALFTAVAITHAPSATHPYRSDAAHHRQEPIWEAQPARA